MVWLGVFAQKNIMDGRGVQDGKRIGKGIK